MDMFCFHINCLFFFLNSMFWCWKRNAVFLKCYFFQICGVQCCCICLKNQIMFHLICNVHLIQWTCSWINLSNKLKKAPQFDLLFLWILTYSIRIGSWRYKQKHRRNHLPIKLAQERNSSMQNRKNPQSPKHTENNIEIRRLSRLH